GVGAAVLTALTCALLLDRLMCQKLPVYKVFPLNIECKSFLDLIHLATSEQKKQLHSLENWLFDQRGKAGETHSFRGLSPAATTSYDERNIAVICAANDPEIERIRKLVVEEDKKQAKAHEEKSAQLLDDWQKLQL
ncbi:unnamed protein product, partial [Amoebophrya sp. A25]